MKYLKAILYIAYFWVMTCVLFTILSLVRFCNWLIFHDIDRRAEHKIATWWGIAAMHAHPDWRIKIEGREHLPREQPCVLVANHESSADIWAIFLLNYQFRWLSKAKWFRVPIVGKAMKWAGYISVEPKSKESRQQALKLSDQWIKRGISMFYFPEGTRSKSNQLLPFHKGAFAIAEDNGVPIVPIVLHGTGTILPKGSWVPQAAEVLVKILPPETKRSEESIEDYASRIRTLISLELGKTP